MGHPRAVSLLAALAELMFPRSCVGCARAGELLCAACAPPTAPIRVASTGSPVTAATAYDGAVRAALLAYKERGRRDLLAPLGALLARAIPESLAAGAVLVPVPSSPAARRTRGGDHVLRLARSASRRRGLPVVPALRLARAVADSAGLSTTQRTENLQGAMRALPPSPGGPALLVDDIVTTGSTLREAERALADAGWAVHGAAVVAATLRRDGRLLAPPRRAG